MKKMLFGISTVTLIVIASCNSNSKSTKENDRTEMSSDTTKKVIDTSAMKEVNHSFTNVDPKLSASLKTVVDHYIHIKNALVTNSGSEAADGGKEMADAINKVDQSLFTGDQKKVYDDIKDDLKENAEHIGKSSGDVGHQREHFFMMSEDV